jgi:sugar phosphate isomerase/epimerase
MNPLAIEPLSLFGMPPVEHVHLAADLGCEHVALGMSGVPWDPPFFSPFSLRDDPQLRVATKTALRDRGITISLADGFLVREGEDVSSLATDLQIMVDLGARLINTVSLDPDLNRSIDQFGQLVDLATAAGVRTTVEVSPNLTIANLELALTAIASVGRPDFGLLIDTMHYGRSGATAADVARVDPALIGYVQISDIRRRAENPNYWDEAMTQRLVPGTGELDLVDLLAVIPDDVVIGIEVPLLAQARAGIEAHERVGQSVRATRDLLAQARAGVPSGS